MDDLTFIIELSEWDVQHGTVAVTARSGSKTLTPTYHGVQIDYLKRPTREDPDDVRAYGMALYKKLFVEEVMNHYQQMVGETSKSGSSIHVQLEIRSDAPELHAVPWELLCDDQGSLALSTENPFSRFLVSGDGDEPAVSERPLRLLLAIANPETLVGNLSEIKGIAETVGALADLIKAQKGKIAGTILPGRNSLSLELHQRLEDEGWTIASGVTSWQNILEHLPRQHIVHIVAHGILRAEGPTIQNRAILLLEPHPGDHEAENLGVDLVSDERIAAGLAGAAPNPQLVFLAACESAKRIGTGVNAFIGLGPTIVKAGVPAVVAMQDEVPMDLTPTLTTRFYQDLFQHGQVDRALNVARASLFKPDSFDWAIPVIFMRLADGQLFVEPEHPVRNRERALDAKPLPSHAGAIVFDSRHGQETWYFDAPTVDEGFKRIAKIARERAVVLSLEGLDKHAIEKSDLRGSKILILAIGPQKRTDLKAREIETIKDFVFGGGGLLVLGTYTGDWHHEANLNTLLQDYGIQFNPDVVKPAGTSKFEVYDSCHGVRDPNTKWKFVVEASPVMTKFDKESLDVQQSCLTGVTSVLTLSSCSLRVSGASATALLQSPQDSAIFTPIPEGITRSISGWVEETETATLVAACKTKRVVVSGCYTMFLDRFVDYSGYDNIRLFRNILDWLMPESA